MSNRYDFSDMMDLYLPYIRSLCKSYPYRHRQDLIQEGLIGLYMAYKHFDESRGTAFEPFAKKCIKNNIISAYRILGRTEADLSIDLDSDNGETYGFSEKAEVHEFFENFRADLSELERKVFDLYLTDLSYEEMSQQLSLPKKSISDAMLRIRRKIKEKYSI